jgi:hypothetical protein
MKLLLTAMLCLLCVLSSVEVYGGIEDRLSITEIDINPAISPGRSDNTGPFWTFADLRATVLSPLPNGESKVGWQDVNGKIHITPLKPDSTRKGDDILIDGDLLYDLVAHDDGVALLLLQSLRMYIIKLSNSGEEIFRTELTDNDDRTDPWHRGKLAWDGEKYAAYFAIHGTAGWTAGHEGDKLKYIDRDGQILSGGWEWGCSHSMDVRILFTEDTDMPVCISDCYPGLGIYLKNRYLLSSVYGDCAGATDARFGQMAEFGGWMAMVYLSIDGRDNWDVVFNSFSAVFNYNVKADKALTDTVVDETNPKIIPYGPESLLVSWERGGSRVFIPVDIEGNQLGQEEVINVKAGPIDDFKLYENLDIGWAFAWGDMNKLKIMRIRHNRCAGDFNNDGDCDGSDLIVLASDSSMLPLSGFAAGFGNTDCLSSNN